MKLRIKFLIITTLEFNKLTAENFAARFKQVNLLSKADFGNKIIIFNKRIISNKTKHLEVQKKLNSLITKYYKFFLDRIYFTSNDGSQNTFFITHLSTNTWHIRIKKDKGTDFVLTWKSKGVYNSKCKPF